MRPLYPPRRTPVLGLSPDHDPADGPSPGGPACARCGSAYRLIVENDLVSARCVVCRSVRVFAPQGSGWAAAAAAGARP